MANRREQGGAYAIKGFLYQFDCTIAEIVNNPGDRIRFETREDIETEEYYIQVKNRGSTKYAPSRIRRAVAQLLDIYREDRTKEFRLYCHFQDRTPASWRPTTQELQQILGMKEKKPEDETVSGFRACLTIEFREDFEAEFARLIETLKKTFQIGTTETAAMYHAVIRSYLLDLSVKSGVERHASLGDIRAVVEDLRTKVTMEGYQQLLGSDRYEKAIRKMYFTHRRANIDNFERLLVVHCGTSASSVELMRLIFAISKKYFVRGKSPQPYVLLESVDPNTLIEVKRSLVDRGFAFCDGTTFNGDRVRMDRLFKDSLSPGMEEALGGRRFREANGKLGRIGREGLESRRSRFRQMGKRLAS